MRPTTILMLVVFSCFPVQAQKEVQYLAPLATGQAPECPEHVGARNLRSEIAKIAQTSVYITGEAVRGASGCRRTAELHIHAGNFDRSYELPVANQQRFTVADFSADGSRLLLFAGRDDEGSTDFRDIQLTVVSTVSGEMHWHNVWDVFQWRDCDATVDPLGFSDDGAIVIRAGPSIWNGHPLPNCVEDARLYSFESTTGSVARWPADVEVKQHGVSAGAACQTCKSDPDIAGACFTVRGRMTLYNGGTPYHIWRIGTDRMLGVRDSIVPESLATNLTWENAAFGDFYVCPFTREREGAMQFVCVESAKKVVYRRKW
ncbi:MAG: hypothetical protein WAL95_08980 [Candidatus Acidiferrales bacterium]